MSKYNNEVERLERQIGKPHDDILSATDERFAEFNREIKEDVNPRRRKLC